MQYTRLGDTGLKVSRICLGMMTYGSPQWRPWVMDEEASRPVVRHAVELGINFFDTADMYSAGESEVLTGKFLREFCSARRSSSPPRCITRSTWASRAAPAARASRTGGRTWTACRASASSTRWTPACSAWAPTTSTCTRSTASTRTRRWRKPWRRCTTWSRPARSATSARAACTRGSSRRCSRSRASAAGRRSRACRTTTTWRTARRSAR